MVLMVEASEKKNGISWCVVLWEVLYSGSEININIVKIKWIMCISHVISDSFNITLKLHNLKISYWYWYLFIHVHVIYNRHHKGPWDNEQVKDICT